MTLRGVWIRWVVVVTAGESAGFIGPAIVGAATADSPGAVAASAAAGIIEGTVLGVSQWFVLSLVIPFMPMLVWVSVTAASAFLAYLIGCLPSLTAGVWAQAPVVVTAASAVGLGGALLASMSIPQAMVLRAYGMRASWRCVVWASGSWVAGLLVFLLTATPLWQPGQPFSVTVMIGIIAGIAMAMTVAAFSGFGVVQLTKDARSGKLTP
ncbi:hypothetical protein QE428_000712 [Microbacterium sp. SORGH_AS 505]|nr:hypothetical protein [Microbacterium sp. SORGH_AS_0505]